MKKIIRIINALLVFSLVFCSCTAANPEKTQPMSSSVTQSQTTISTSTAENNTTVHTTTPQTTPSHTTAVQTTHMQNTAVQTKPVTATTTPVLTTTPDTTPDVPNSDTRSPIKEEIRGVWVATVYRLDFPSASKLSASELKAQIEALVDSLSNGNFNAVFFQVRPTSDALYKSEIFPSSHWITGEQGAPFADGFDILEYLVSYAHERNIAVHAWINPYRVTNGASMKLSKNNPASLHPEWTFELDGKLYYNPGCPEVTQLIARGAREIAENYDVDGIIFDDYFYPNSTVFRSENSEDDLDYEQYVKYGEGFEDIASWRRENINSMIKCVFEEIKAASPDCLFGVAPSGIWNNKSEDCPSGSDSSGRSAYELLFCDALAWANGGYVDYLSPQIYWSTDNKSAPFKTLASWWHNALADSQTPLIISYNAYSLDPSQTPLQVAYARELDSYHGFIFYNYNNIYSSNERLDAITNIKEFQIKKEE